MTHEVFLGPTAFLAMGVAAVEVYPRETVGVLVGLKGVRKTIVEYAVPIQTAERERDGVGWMPRVEERIKRFMTGSTGLEVVGRFHSHPWPEKGRLFKGMNLMSDTDRRSWNPRELEVVVGLVKNGGVDGGKPLEWRHLSGGTLQGEPLGNTRSR